jgi:phosphohistidine phosphatase
MVDLVMTETGYRQLIVLRHAKTEQEAASDRARKLTERGRRDARAAGQWLREQALSPDVILTSPAARAVETAELVAAELTSPEHAAAPAVTTVEDLYGADVGDVVDIVATLEADPRRVLVVGHNPTMAQLAYDLQREPSQPWAGHLPTAGIAVLAVQDGWPGLATGSAELVHWYVPRG